MTEQIIANRYAQALFMIGQEQNMQTLEAYSKSLLAIEKMLTGSPLLLNLFSNPIITPSEKQQTLIQLFKKIKVDQNIVSFFILLAKKNRLPLVSKITHCFISLFYKAKNITVCKLTTAITLDKKKQKKFTLLLEKQTHRQLLVTFITDPDILGGLILQLGDKILDVSIRKQLILLKDTIKRDE